MPIQMTPSPTSHRIVRPTRSARAGGAAALVAGLFLGGLLGGSAGCNAKPAAAQPPPPEVAVAHPVQKEVVEWDTYTGHLEAPESANVSARVSGLVIEMPFLEGSIVKRGDVLAVIDDRPFKADLDSKRADQQNAESGLSIAKVTFDRLAQLRKRVDAVSQQDVDNARAKVEQAEAVLAGAKAAVESSRLLTAGKI